MWNESGAAAGDFTRVVALVRSQSVHILLESCSHTIMLTVILTRHAE